MRTNLLKNYAIGFTLIYVLSLIFKTDVLLSLVMYSSLYIFLILLLISKERKIEKYKKDILKNELKEIEKAREVYLDELEKE